ncbi:hypothetical protein Ahy_B05g076445 [Arachis hypogaea]|uniref:Peptidase A1 domain-containing protein n=1 Tax=Arachis hypogaea TaxID=3818 RepID=A0A444Z3A3_ARAHY|nr:hypothetical protein Ahy_B05g076445 [Arachis hypogaea]
MAPLLLLFFIFFASSSPLTHSRTRPLKTTMLDVASSLQKTTRNGPTSYSLKTQPSESTLSLQLLSRASIQKHQSYTNNYKLFTLSLLERDSARVKVIETRLDLALKRCRNGTCLYEVSYGDGSFTVGEFATETITLGSVSVPNVAIGCGHNNEGLFVGAAGLLGLGGGALSFPAQLNATSFSYCLVDRDSDHVSTLEFHSALSHYAVTAPLRRNKAMNTFYYVGLTGIGVGGEVLPIPEASFEVDSTGAGGVIVDSGTAVTRLKEEVYDVLRDAFLSGTKGLQRANGVALFDTCYDLSSKSSVEVPTVSFHFPGGRELPLPAKNYLIPVDSVGTFCFAFAPTTSSLSIIGNVQQQGTRVGFDVANWVVGFSVDSC